MSLIGVTLASLQTHRQVTGRKLDGTVLSGWPPDTDFSSGPLFDLQVYRTSHASLVARFCAHCTGLDALHNKKD